MSDELLLKGMGGFIRVKDLVDLLGVSRSTIFRMGQRGELPKKVRIGARAVGWKISEIQAFIESREVV